MKHFIQIQFNSIQYKIQKFCKNCAAELEAQALKKKAAEDRKKFLAKKEKIKNAYMATLTTHIGQAGVRGSYFIGVSRSNVIPTTLASQPEKFSTDIVHLPHRENFDVNNDSFHAAGDEDEPNEPAKKAEKKTDIFSIAKKKKGNPLLAALSSTM